MEKILRVARADKPRASSQYRGVSFNQTARKWRAQYRNDGINKIIGNFDTELEAAREYAEVAKRLGRPYTLLPL
jgi:hypothetical protein